jgi:hypothetical protein
MTGHVQSPWRHPMKDFAPEAPDAAQPPDGDRAEIAA